MGRKKKLNKRRGLGGRNKGVNGEKKEQERRYSEEAQENKNWEGQEMKVVGLSGEGTRNWQWLSTRGQGRKGTARPEKINREKSTQECEG